MARETKETIATATVSFYVQYIIEARETMARAEKKVLDLDSSSSSSSAPSSSDDESSSSSSSSDEEDNNKLTINSKFAKEYQERKRRQELTNERQRKTRFGDDDEEGVNSDSSSSESEDEDGELLTPTVDLQILKVRFTRDKDFLICIYTPLISHWTNQRSKWILV